MLLLGYILGLSLSFAGGDWVGNGGNLIICEDNQPQLLDYFEGLHDRGIEVDHGSSGEFSERIESVLRRLERINPERALRYRTWFKTFFLETRFFEEGKILPIRDVGPIVIPSECNVQQVAAQRPTSEIMPGDSRYLIDRRFWQKLSHLDKAGLVLHELIYREAIESNQRSSPRVRYFNQILSSAQISRYSEKDMLGLIRLVGMRFAEYKGFELDLWDAEYYPDGSLSLVWSPKVKAWIKFDRQGEIEKVIKK